MRKAEKETTKKIKIEQNQENNQENKNNESGIEDYGCMEKNEQHLFYNFDTGVKVRFKI